MCCVGGGVADFSMRIACGSGDRCWGMLAAVAWWRVGPNGAVKSLYRLLSLLVMLAWLYHGLEWGQLLV